ADWGKNHRFAGSSDRAAIGNLVYDALRCRRSLAARMQSDSPRALALAAGAKALGLGQAAVIASADGSAYALEPLSEAERAGLWRPPVPAVSAGIEGDIPDWLQASLAPALRDAARA